jgi:hypothetical protein
MAKTKGKSSSEFVWRANLLKEKRKMRKKRNERKKREWRAKKDKTKRVEEEEVRVAMQGAQAEALLYKKLAAKYKALGKGTAKRNDDKVNTLQLTMNDIVFSETLICFFSHIDFRTSSKRR